MIKKQRKAIIYLGVAVIVIGLFTAFNGIGAVVRLRLVAGLSSVASGVVLCYFGAWLLGLTKLFVRLRKQRQGVQVRCSRCGNLCMVNRHNSK